MNFRWERNGNDFCVAFNTGKWGQIVWVKKILTRQKRLLEEAARRPPRLVLASGIARPGCNIYTTEIVLDFWKFCFKALGNLVRGFIICGFTTPSINFADSLSDLFIILQFTAPSVSLV